LHNIAFKIKS